MRTSTQHTIPTLPWLLSKISFLHVVKGFKSSCINFRILSRQGWITNSCSICFYEVHLTGLEVSNPLRHKAFVQGTRDQLQGRHDKNFKQNFHERKIFSEVFKTRFLFSQTS